MTPTAPGFESAPIPPPAPAQGPEFALKTAAVAEARNFQLQPEQQSREGGLFKSIGQWVGEKFSRQTQQNANEPQKVIQEISNFDVLKEIGNNAEVVAHLKRNGHSDDEISVYMSKLKSENSGMSQTVFEQQKQYRSQAEAAQATSKLQERAGMSPAVRAQQDERTIQSQGAKASYEVQHPPVPLRSAEAVRAELQAKGNDAATIAAKIELMREEGKLYKTKDEIAAEQRTPQVETTTIKSVPEQPTDQSDSEDIRDVQDSVVDRFGPDSGATPAEGVTVDSTTERQPVQSLDDLRVVAEVTKPWDAEKLRNQRNGVNIKTTQTNNQPDSDNEDIRDVQDSVVDRFGPDAGASPSDAAAVDSNTAIDKPAKKADKPKKNAQSRQSKPDKPLNPNKTNQTVSVESQTTLNPAERVKNYTKEALAQRTISPEPKEADFGGNRLEYKKAVMKWRGEQATAIKDIENDSLIIVEMEDWEAANQPPNADRNSPEYSKWLKDADEQRTKLENKYKGEKTKPVEQKDQELTPELVTALLADPEVQEQMKLLREANSSPEQDDKKAAAVTELAKKNKTLAAILQILFAGGAVGAMAISQAAKSAQQG